MFQAALDAVQAENWKLVAIFAVGAIVLGVKRYASKFAFLAFFSTVRGAAALAILTALAGALLNAVLAQGSEVQVTFNLVATAFTVGLAAIPVAIFDELVTGSKE
jgi:hypothetical protein